MASFSLIFLTWVGFLLNLLLSLFMAVGLYRIFRVKNEIQWEARHFGPLAFAVFFTILFVSVERNLQLFGTVSGYFDLGTQLRWILNNFFTFGILSAYGLRAWIVHFDYHTGVAMLVEITNWNLDEPKAREQFEWFLLNKSSYGSPKYLTQFLGAMVIIFTLAIWGWIVVSEATFYYGMVIIYAGIMFVIMAVTKKLLAMEDFLFIRREMLIEFRILAGFFMIMGILIIFGSTMGWDYCSFFVLEASVVAMTAMATISTWWMLDKSELFNLPLTIEKRLRELEVDDDEYQMPRNAPTLSEVLKDEEAITFFLKHLIRELSLENIFFLADVMHFKASLMSNFEYLNKVQSLVINLPDLARYRFSPNRTLVQHAWGISHAYVEDISASYVTAIHDETRDNILEYLTQLEPEKEAQFAPEDWIQLYTVFDPAVKEVWNLLIQSWRRYVLSTHFSEFKMSDEAETEKLNQEQNSPPPDEKKVASETNTIEL